MSFVQIVGALHMFGADVLLLAIGVTLTVSLLKKTVMKSFDKKVFVFLPFGLGVAYYAVYRMIAAGNGSPLFSGLVQTLEGGFGCGCAATLYYVVYEQLLRGKLKRADPLLPLLAFLPEAVQKEAAKALFEGGKDLDGEELETFLKETLQSYSDVPMSEEELSEIVSILEEYLLSLRKK